MMAGLVRRLSGVVLVLIGVMLLIFVMLRIIPGDPASVLLNEHVSPSTIAKLTESMGLNKSLPEQFWDYLKGVLKGDFGESYYLHQSVNALMTEAFPYTIRLACMAAAFAWCFGIFSGIVSVIRYERLLDYLFRGLSLLGISVPIFMVALFLQYLLYYRWSLVPLTYDGSIFSLILPAVVLGWDSAGSIARLTRSGLIEQMGEPYIDTAKAKGLIHAKAVWTHALRNAILPVITMMALQLSGMLSGAVITESIFGIPGLGRLALTAIQTRDMPLLQGTVLFSAFLIALGNMAADIINTLLDPRRRWG